MKTLGKRIINMREIYDMKQKDLAEKIDVTKATMSKYENDKCFPNAEALRKLALALGTSADYLVGMTEDARPCRTNKQKVREHKGFSMRALTQTVSKLSKANKIRVMERALTLLEQQNEN